MKIDMFKNALFFLNTSFILLVGINQVQSISLEMHWWKRHHTLHRTGTSSTFGKKKQMAIWENSFMNSKARCFPCMLHLLHLWKKAMTVACHMTPNLPNACVPTFINVCGWLSTKGIDVRQHIDPHCLHNVEVLRLWWNSPWTTYDAQISDSAEIRSNIKIDENYLKGYHWYASSFMINRVGLITDTWSKTISVLYLPSSAPRSEGNRCYKYRGGESETESPPSSQWKLCCFYRAFSTRICLEEWYSGWHIQPWSLVQILLLWSWYLSIWISSGAIMLRINYRKGY